MIRFFLFAVWLSSTCGLASAQTPAQTSTDLQSALQAAQAGANKPGDEALGCDALENELVATAGQPELQSYVAKSGAAAQARSAEAKVGSGRVATQKALTVFGSIVPGGAWAGVGSAMAEAPAQRAQTAGNLQQRMQQTQEMMRVMPQMMRGQRVIELAQARKCAWVQGQAR